MYRQIGIKKCGRCGQAKPVDQFDTYASGTSRLHTNCRECEQTPQRAQHGSVRCQKCREIKTHDHYTRNPSGRMRQVCEACRAKTKRRYTRNPSAKRRGPIVRDQHLPLTDGVVEGYQLLIERQWPLPKRRFDGLECGVCGKTQPGWIELISHMATEHYQSNGKEAEPCTTMKGKAI